MGLGGFSKAATAHPCYYPTIHHHSTKKQHFGLSDMFQPFWNGPAFCFFFFFWQGGEEGLQFVFSLHAHWRVFFLCGPLVGRILCGEHKIALLGLPHDRVYVSNICGCPLPIASCRCKTHLLQRFCKQKDGCPLTFCIIQDPVWRHASKLETYGGDGSQKWRCIFCGYKRK